MVIRQQGDTKEQTTKEIAAVVRKVDDNTVVTETTHQIVNSQRTAMIKELAAMRAELAAMKQAKAVDAAVEQAQDDK